MEPRRGRHAGCSPTDHCPLESPMLPLGRVLALAAALLVLTAMPPFVRPAPSGCCCDHPPPAFAPVMPPFGSPGRTIRLYADGGFFVPGARYSIAFQP